MIELQERSPVSTLNLQHGGSRWGRGRHRLSGRRAARPRPRLEVLEDRCLLAAPVAVNDFYATPIDTPLLVPAPGILANDTDPDDDAFQSIQVDFADLQGVAVLTTLGPGLGQLSYSPPLGFTGTTTFTYQVTDTNDEQSNVATVTIYVGTPPEGVPDVYATPENTTLDVFPFEGVLVNDLGFPIQAVLVDGPTNGSLSLFGNGSFIYTPALDYTGPDGFTYKPWDGVTPLELVDPVQVYLFVNDVDEVPVANTDFYSVDEDATLAPPAPGVLINDASPDGLPLTALLVFAPSNAAPGGFTLNADGSFSYTPLPDFFGDDYFVYRAIDSRGMASEETTVFLTILPVNDAPTAVDDEFTVSEGETLFVAGPGVLANDTDPENDFLSSFVVTAPANGSLSLSSDGSFVYTPNPFFNGVDTFTYQAFDGGLPSANVAIVTINVLPVNNAPVAQDDIFATNEDTSLNVAAPGVLANDSDPDGDPLTAVLVTNPLFGVVTLNADGSFLYTPNPLFNGVDTFTYRASDGLATSEIATVTILVAAVNNAPTANDDAFTTDEGQTLVVAAPGVLGNDTDPDGDLLSSFVISNPTNGTLVLNSDGSFVYTPNPFFNGIDTFTYQASDGELLSGLATVTITVLPVNNAPVATDDFYSTTEDQALNVAAPGILGNDFDPDGDPLTAVLVTNPLHGVLALNADGSFSYTPNLNFNGTDSFTYRASDGTLQSNIATVTITVAAANDPPVAVDDFFTTIEDQPLIVAAPGILANDIDPDGDPLTAILLSNPTNGVLVLNGNGSFAYTPFANFAGIDTFTYQAFDGTALSNLATVTITVLAVPEAPVANDDSYQVREDRTLTVAAPGILLNDLNPDGGPVTITVINGPLYADSFVVNNDGSFTYTPEANFNGSDSFLYFLTNVDTGLTSNAATVTIIVRAEPDVPVANPDSFTTNEDVPLVVSAPGVLANDINVDGGLLSAVVIAGPSFGSVLLESNGSFVYTPDPNFNGTDGFTYIAVNGAGVSTPATVTIVVRPVADAPVAVDDAYTTQRGTRLTVPAPGILGNDFDLDGDPITVVLVNPPQNGTLVLNLNGGFVYTPFANFAGTDSFTYRASDGVLTSNLATVTLTVTAVAPPTIRLDPESDTGISPTDRITNDNTPTFLGTGRPGQTITLFTQLAGTLSPVAVGSGLVDSAGSWEVTTQLLADGTYAITAAASNPDGLVTDTILGGPITIDTVAPVVTDALLTPKTGQVYITFQDDRVGLAQSTIVNVANYSFSKIYSHAPRAFAVNSTRAVPAADPTAPQTVVLDVFGGRHLTHGRYLLAALSGGIADVAGNALDGDFNGTYPSGNGTSGGNFLGQFDNNGRNNTRAIATTEFVPIVSTPPGRAPSIPVPVARTPNRGPTGPLGLNQARQEAIKARRALWIRSADRSTP